MKEKAHTQSCCLQCNKLKCTAVAYAGDTQSTERTWTVRSSVAVTVTVCVLLVTAEY
jgi:hypothetical protein